LQGDPEANLCHFALHKLRKFPHEILELPERERAFVYASMMIRNDNEKKEIAKIKSGGGRQ
jgi:hypothetical protein